MLYQRSLSLKDKLKRKSQFLLGPRATGKSWLINNELQDAQIFNLLESEVFERFLRRPQSLSEEISSSLVVIDEIQKLPKLLDEVHRLIEEKKLRFLLTGSSARKLKHGGANLLGGRAGTLNLFPLTRNEITDFDLVKYCTRGGLPLVWQSEQYWSDLRDYVLLYMKEEIISEAVVRKVDHYARFLDVAGLNSGEELNYQKISSDSGVPVRTVDNFVEVLKDTLLAFELEPFRKTKTRKAVAKSKLYFFDVGVANYLSGRKVLVERSEAFGKAFEHFIIQEIRAYLSYRELDLGMTYWRTRSEQAEVDLIIGDELALEIKSYDKFSQRSLKGLELLKQEKKIKKYFLVSRDPVPRQVGGISVLSYSDFLDQLWANELIS